MKKENVEGELVSEDWQEYRSEEFQFEIRYPENWQVMEDRSIPFRPILSLLPRTEDIEHAPTQHQIPDFSYVSIFPKGGATEGVIGQTREMKVESFQWSMDPDRSHFYLLSCDEVWAQFVTPEKKPDSWNRHGFLWAAARVDDFRVECHREGRKLSRSECEPLLGDQLIRYGTVDKQGRKLTSRILHTFRFLPNF